MRKQLVVYANETKAVVMNKNGQYKVFEGTTKREASLKALTYAFSRIPEISDDTFRIIVADKSFLQQVSYVQNLRYYLINNKTKGGEAFTAEEMEQLKALHEARKNSYLTYTTVITEKQLKREEKDSWKQWHLAVDSVKVPVASNKVSQAKTTTAVDNSAIIAKLQAKMEEALDNGDFDMYDKFAERLAKLQPAEEAQEEIEEIEVPTNEAEEPKSEDWLETDEEEL